MLRVSTADEVVIPQERLDDMVCFITALSVSDESYLIPAVEAVLSFYW